MKNKLWILAGLAILVGLQFSIRTPFAEDIWEKSITAGSTLKYALGWQPDNKELKSDDWESKGIKQYTLTHEQEVWIGALQWGESNGIKTALNPKDRNGKRSVGCYQFQDDTFRLYVEKYQLLDIKNLDESDWLNWIWDCDLQTEIVKRMLGDNDVNWRNEFPDVIRNKIGLPPKK